MRPFPTAILLLAAVLGSGEDAFAFCRTTTCACKTDGPLLDANNEQVFNDKGVPQTICGQANGQCPRNDDGCQMTGTPIAWTGSCVGFSPNLDGTEQLSEEDYETAFDTAFQAWALADCGGGKHPSIQAFKLRSTTCGSSPYNADGPNVNSVYFTDDGWTDFKPLPDGGQPIIELDAVIAKTKVTFGSTGVIWDADMAINSATHLFTTSDDAVAYDLVSVITHEAGHFYGLDHSSDASAVMYYAYNPGSVKRELQPDDIAAICAAYPPDRTAACDPTPRGGLLDTCGPKPSVDGCSSVDGSASSAVPTMVLGVLLLAKRRRAR